MRRYGTDITAAGFILLIIASAPMAWGQVRSSASFQMERDSVNIAGDFSTSSSFELTDTVGEAGTGRSTSTNFLLEAGFQQQDVVTLTLTSAGDVVMDAAIGGVTGGTSNGSTSVQASTDGPAGYQLTIQASQSPAMQSSGNTIADYAPGGAAADTQFTTTANDAHFGFSPFGDDLVDRYRVSGSVCGSGTASTTACWDGLSTSPVTIASATGANAPAGATTTLYFRVGIGGAATQPPGTYVATTTVTLLSL